MTNDVGELERLEEDASFWNLGDVPRLSLLRILEVGRDELPHSRLLASVLDPRRHRHGARVLKELVARLPLKERIEDALGHALRDVASIDVREERSFLLPDDRIVRIDIWVQLTTKDDKSFVLALENKIDASERHDQLRDYQEVIERESPNGLLVFLTPSGRRARSQQETHRVPCIEVGYDLLADAVLAAAAELDAGDRASLEELARYWKESIVEDKATKEAVRRLWKQHGKAAELLQRLRPGLRDIRDSYERTLTQALQSRGLSASFSHWPERRGSLEEIKCRVPEWTAKGLPLTIMLYAKGGDAEYGSGRPGVQLVVSANEYEKARGTLRAFAERAGGAIDKEFPPLRHWPHWRRVLKSPPPPHPAHDDLSFDIDVETKPRGWDRATIRTHLDGRNAGAQDPPLRGISDLDEAR